MANGGENSSNNEKAPKASKGLRFVVRIWALVAALGMISTGLFVMVTITAKCFIAGVVQISVGVVVVLLETPVFCASFTKLVKISDWVEVKFRYWMRAALYLGLAVIPIFLCFELSTFMGCGGLGILALLHCLLTIRQRGAVADKTGPEFQSSRKPEDIEMRASLITPSGDPNELNTY